MDRKLKVFIRILVLGIGLAIAGFILEKVVSARVEVAKPFASPSREVTSTRPAEQTATPTLLSFEYGMWGNVRIVPIDVICTGEDFANCAKATDQSPVLNQNPVPALGGKVLDCELGSRCQEVPFKPYMESKFLTTPTPP